MTSKSRRQYCGSSEHAFSRRQFLGTGAAATAGMLGGLDALASPSLSKEIQKNDRRVILLWLAGGPSQLETFDPKPGRPTGGPFFSIPTDVPGVHFSELMPKMAKRFGKHMAVIRSLNTKNASHGSASQTMMRGRRDEATVKYPDLGAVVAKEFGKPNSQVPENVSIYSATEGRNFSKLTPSFLGARYATIKLAEKMGLADVQPLKGLKPDDQHARAELRKLLSDKFSQGRSVGSVNSHNMAYSRVPGLMRSNKLFDISKEPEKVRAKYGPTQFGQQALIARRLVEAGVPFVRLARAWWDTHAQNFESHLELVTELDHVMSTLMDDLHERGLLKHTLIITLAEFGRTPKINGSVGRDHFARAWSSSLSGVGVKHGACYGKTDKDGQTVSDGEIGAGQLFATIYEALGVAHNKDYYIGSRPIPLVNPGIKPVKDVLA